MRKREREFNPAFPSGDVSETYSNAVFAINQKKGTTSVFLSSVKCFVKDSYDEKWKIRGLFDVGSMTNLITKKFLEKLGLRKEKVNILVTCLNDSSVCVKNCVTTEISNSDGSYKKRIQMLVVDKITDLTPVKNLNVKGLIPENINLANDSFYVPGPIDCLLGAEMFYELLRSGQIRSENSNLIFQNTVFGFVASGSNSFADTEVRVHCGLIKGDLNQTLKMFWELENVEVEKTKNEEAIFVWITSYKRILEMRRVATRTLLQLSGDEEKNFPLAAHVLRENFYMDDVLCGAASLMEAKALKNQLSSILKKGGMELHKWVELKDSYTKTCVLSTIARLFDPLGLLGPVVARAKIFMQSLWSLKIDWIDELPSERAKEWHRFLEDFNSVRSISGRCIVHPQATRVELHGFADASEKCYGAVIYCRSQSPDGATTVKLVTSKSRVAPVKSVTMPRLELCAAVLLAKLIKRVETALQMKTPPCTCGVTRLLSQRVSRRSLTCLKPSWKIELPQSNT
ncbi:uncharacterized protein TNCV_4471341 [Trichonephila clavipes]|uniref:Peptidase aspartic putative domain-containing protein n=1 Tax=Trichonephila clavipes TaxID=2585209 RepID=A0A8X6SQH0_TRICX|nr:uncharacterized protein TNCV_4471341 [Trichonephila clavipes]